MFKFHRKVAPRNKYIGFNFDGNTTVLRSFKFIIQMKTFKIQFSFLDLAGQMTIIRGYALEKLELSENLTIAPLLSFFCRVKKTMTGNYHRLSQARSHQY